MRRRARIRKKIYTLFQRERTTVIATMVKIKHLKYRNRIIIDRTKHK